MLWLHFREIKLLENNRGDRKVGRKLSNSKIPSLIFRMASIISFFDQLILESLQDVKSRLLLVSIDNNYSSFLVYMTAKFFYLLQKVYQTFLYKCAGSRLAIKSGKKIESGSFTLKRNQMFCAQTTPEKLKRATIVGHLRKTRSGKSNDFRDAIAF